VELHKIRLLGLPKDQESLILGRNVLRLISKRGEPRRLVPVRRASRIDDESELAPTATPA
jgi:hypothetical protein